MEELWANYIFSIKTEYEDLRDSHIIPGMTVSQFS